MSATWKLRLDRERFLAEYWQKTPLLIENAIDGFIPPISSDELAGLALEEDFESRLIEQCDTGWNLHHGPFSAADYERDRPWNLLVQAVDHYMPAVAELRQLIDFLPQWRVDDVMVSYATDGGSVGPHYDNYDVFLLQGEGEKLWQLGQFCDSSSALLPHDELRILEAFIPHQEYLLRTGDMLYVPPGIAHWGVARGDSTTFSIGFRAPRVKDMVARWVDHLLEQLEPEQFYQDSRRVPLNRPGEIPPDDLKRAMAQLQDALDQASGNDWFGELVTEPRDEPLYEDFETAQALLRGKPECIELLSSAKLAWQQEAAGIQVFANGERRPFSAAVLPSLLLLCDKWILVGAEVDEAMVDADTVSLLEYLLEKGVVCVG
jgi:50S ribosomal protein L16 3-hydroxylase